MITGPADLLWMVTPTLAALVSALLWGIVAFVGRALWERDMRRPGLLLGLAGAVGVLLELVGLGLTVSYVMLLPEAYATVEGGWLTTERLQGLADGAWTLVSLLRLGVYGALAAAVFVDRGSPQAPD